MSINVKNDFPTTVACAPDNPVNALDEKGELKQRLAEAVCRWMKIICENQGTAEKAKKDPQTLRKAIWYPHDHYEAATDTKGAEKIVEFLDKRTAYMNGFLDHKYFELIPDPQEEDGRRCQHFILKSGQLASVALKTAIQGLALIGCGVACQIARYGALLDILGEKKFDSIFNLPHLRMNLGFDKTDQQPMQLFTRQTPAARSALEVFPENPPLEHTGVQGNRPISKGDLVYINGVVSHRFKHLWDDSYGFNLVCTDDTPGAQRFIGFGLQSSMTEAEINDFLVTAYNSSPDLTYSRHPGKQPRYEKNKAKAQEYRDHQVESLDPQKRNCHNFSEGFLHTHTQEFNLDVVQAVINESEEVVHGIFANIRVVYR